MKIHIEMRPNMAPTDETYRLAKEIGDRIDAAVKADPRNCEVIANLVGLKLPALNKIRAGQSNKMYAKLALLAKILNRSPNHLLGFEVSEREVLTGALEGVFEGLRYDPSDARALAGIVLTVIDKSEADAPNPRESAHLIAKFLAQQSVDLQRK